MTALHQFVSTNFQNSNFSMGDVISLAGKVAFEASFPCQKVAWSFGRGVCTTSTTETPEGPGGDINTLAGLQPFLTRFNLTTNEMAVLVAGSHGVSGAHAAVNDNGFGTFQMAVIASGVDWIRKSISSTWTPTNSTAGKTQFIDLSTLPKVAGPPGGGGPAAIGRLPSDLVFFPSTLQNQVKDIQWILSNCG